MESEDRRDGQWENHLISKYVRWRTTYHPYLCALYDYFLKLYKGAPGRYIDFEEFVSFAYKTSSGYISKFA